MTLATPAGVAGTLERQERRFALALFAPAFLLLLVTTTAPLVFLGWNSLQKLDLSMPWLSGFAGLENYTKMGSDPRFWNSLWLTVVYTASTVILQVIIGLSLALLVLQIPRGQGLLRVAATLPIVLSVTDQSGEARYPSFKGIMAAKKKPVQTWSLADLGVDPAQVGLDAAWSRVEEVTARPPRTAGEVVADEFEQPVVAPGEGARPGVEQLVGYPVVAATDAQGDAGGRQSEGRGDDQGECAHW